MVVIPEENMQFGNWYGTGYVVLDPTSGAAGYLISGGIQGGSTAMDVAVGMLALVNIIWPVVDAIAIVGALLAATNPFVAILYFAVFILTIYVCRNTAVGTI